MIFLRNHFQLPQHFLKSLYNKYGITPELLIQLIDQRIFEIKFRHSSDIITIKFNYFNKFLRVYKNEKLITDDKYNIDFGEVQIDDQ